MAKTKTTTTISHQLVKLETATRNLLRHGGALQGEYDSARLSEALGLLSQAADALHTAAIVRQAQERSGETD